MSYKIPDIGEQTILHALLDYNDLVLHLYSAGPSPIVEGSVLGDFSEATTTGYSAATLTAGEWTIATDAGTTTAEYAEVEFTLTGPDTLAGYYVTLAGELVLAEEFAEPIVISSLGTTVRIVPIIGCDDCG